MNRFVPGILKKLVGVKDLTIQSGKQSRKIGANMDESDLEWQKEKVPENEVEIKGSRNICLMLDFRNLEQKWQGDD